MIPVLLIFTVLIILSGALHLAALAWRNGWGYDKNYTVGWWANNLGLIVWLHAITAFTLIITVIIKLLI